MDVSAMFAAAGIVALAADIPLSTPQGKILGLFMFGAFFLLVGAAWLSSRRRRHVPLARRKGTRENEFLMRTLARRREATR